MDMLLSQSHSLFRYLVEWGILLLEFFGTMVLLASACKSILKWLKKQSGARQEMAKGILLSLSFKMGGEVLRTVIVEESVQLVTIFAIILLRGLVAALIYWELTKEMRLAREAREAGQVGELE